MSDGGQGPPGGGRRRREEAVHRGIRWRRSVGGTITWLNENRGRWVTWYPGTDAPPLPPGWEAEAASFPAPGGPTPAPGGPTPAPGPAPSAGGGIERPPMRSAYRLLPVLIALGIVAVAVWQGTHPALKATPQDIAQARALDGRCLTRSGGTAAQPKYAPTPVSCSSSQAVVKVVEVLVPGAKGQARHCPPGDGAVRVVEAGVQGEPVECTAPLRRQRANL